MDKNFFLAFFLSTLVIIGYYWMYPPEAPVPQTEVGQEAVQPEEEQAVGTTAMKAAISLPEPLVPLKESTTRKKVSVETSLFSIGIDSQEGILRSFYLKGYKYAIEQHTSLKTIVFDFVSELFSGKSKKKKSLEIDPNRLINLAGDLSVQNRVWKFSTDLGQTAVNFHISDDNLNVKREAKTLTLQATLENGLEIYKIFTFYPNSYQIDMELKVVNRTGESQRIFPRFNFGAANEVVEFQPRARPKMGISYVDDNFEKHDDEDDYIKPFNIRNARWAGVMDTYFLTAVKMTGTEELFNGELHAIDSVLADNVVKIPKLEYTESKVDLLDNQEYSKQFSLFMGPKEHDLLEEFDKSLIFSMDLGWFDWLAQPILVVLRWIQTYVINWGVAIILLTIVVRIAMLPLAYKGMISMAKMSDLSPQMAKIREKHKGNKQQLNKEIMEFYKKNKVNPMGGCFPMLLQIPIFIALYQALLPAIELRHSPFMLWIDDLSAADFTLILPLLMGVTMFLQQSLTPTPAMDPTQAKMMKWMPLMFIFFFLDMPSGLVLYWVVSNVISIFQQMFFNKIKKSKGIGTQAKAHAPIPVSSKGKKKKKK